MGFKETPQESSLILDMQIDTYPGLFITNNKNQEDKCLGIVDVSFVNGDDTDSFLVKLSLVFFLVQDDQISIALGGYPTQRWRKIRNLGTEKSSASKHFF